MRPICTATRVRFAKLKIRSREGGGSFSSFGEPRLTVLSAAGSARRAQEKGIWAVRGIQLTMPKKGQHWDVSTLNPNRQKFLARLGRKYTAQALHCMGPERCYPIRLGFFSIVSLTWS